MSVELAVHEAIYDALTDPAQTALAALIGTRVYDRVPGPQPTYPYVVMSALDVRDISNSCGKSYAAGVALTVYANSVGRAAEVLEIGGLMRDILAPASHVYQTVSGFRIVTHNSLATVYREGPSPLIEEGVVTLTYIVNPTT